MDQGITAKFIMDTITGWVQQKEQIKAEQWINYALKLEMLLTFEHDKLINLEHDIAVLLQKELATQEKINVTAAKEKIKADPLYKELRKQELFIKQIDEVIRLAKHYAKLVSFI